MTDLQHTIDRAAARLTHAEPRPDVRARVLASIVHAPRGGRWPLRSTLVLAAAGAVVALGATFTIARWRHADLPQAVAQTRTVAAIGAGSTRTVLGAQDSAAGTTAAAGKPTASRKRAAPPVPEYVTPTPLPVVTVEAIDAPAEIQPTPLSIPQLSRKPIAPGSVTSTMLDENGSSRER